MDRLWRRNVRDCHYWLNGLSTFVRTAKQSEPDKALLRKLGRWLLAAPKTREKAFTSRVRYIEARADIKAVLANLGEVK